ncbi:gem-associated protein 4-like [Ciona intestinalis]
MELTAEWTLLHKTKFAKDQTLILDNIISDIISGLQIEHSNLEAESWKSKVAFVLLNTGLCGEGLVCDVNAANMYVTSTTVGWEVIFKLCTKHKLFKIFMKHVVRLQVAVCGIVLNALQTYLGKLKVEKEFVPCCISVVVGSISALHELSYHDTHSENLVNVGTHIKDLISTVHCNIETLGCCALTEKDCVVIKEVTKDFTMSVSCPHEIKLRNVSSILSDLVNCGATGPEISMKHHIQILDSVFGKENSNPHAIPVSSPFHDVMKKAIDCFRCLASKIDDKNAALLELLNKSEKLWTDGISDVENKDQVRILSADIPGVVHQVKYMLLGHEDAVKVILHWLKCVNKETALVKMSLEALHIYHTALVKPEHVIWLFEALHSCNKHSMKSFTENDYYSLYQLFLLWFNSMHPKSKLKLFQNFIHVDSSFDTTFISILSSETRCAVESNFHRELNIVFNTFTCKSDKQDDAVMQLTTDICSLALVSQTSLLKKLAQHSLSHEDHCEVIAQVLFKLPNLIKLLVPNTSNKVDLLHYIFKEIKLKDESELTNLFSFLNKLIKLLKTSPETAEASTLLCSDLLRTYILPSLFEKGNQQNLPVAYSVKLCYIYFENASSVLSLLDILCITYNLAKKLSGLELDQDTRLTVSDCLVQFVDKTSHLFSSQTKHVTALLTWYDHLISSLHWRVQLYLTPIASHNKHFRIRLPKLLQTIVNIPEDLKIDLIDCKSEGTALIMWLQCLMINPGLLPISFLNIQDLNSEQQDLFSAGLVVALAQVLPGSNENEWRILIDVVKSLITDSVLHIALPLNKLDFLPYVDLNECKVQLGICYLLHRVTVVLSSSCCRSWMTMQNWTLFSKSYAITVKSFIGCNDVLSPALQQFMLFHYFQNSCDFLVFIESLNQYENGGEFVFVLLLDLVNEFSQISNENLNKSNQRDVLKYKLSMQSSIETISNPVVENALLKKLSTIQTF